MSFDLDIKNYQKKELEEMFELPDIYDKSILETQELKLKENIISNNKISPDIKSKTIEFLNQAKKLLIDDVVEGVHSLKKSFENFYNASTELKPTTTLDESGHMVQERRNTPFLSSYPSDFFPGVINPIKKRITRQNLNIDSRFRDNYYNSTSSNFYIDLPIKFDSILTIQLASIELPTSFYVISKQLGNNFFTIKISETNESETIYIPDGNYENQDLINYINSCLEKLGGKLQYIIFSVDINSVNNSGSGNVAVGISSKSDVFFNFTLEFQVDKYGIEEKNTPLPLKFGWLLGFRNGVYLNNNVYVSEGIIDLSGPKYAYLVVDDFNNNVNNSFYSAFNSSILNKNILSRISLQKAVKFSSFSENNLTVITFPRQYFGPVDIQKLHIQLLDEYGRIMDLNNMDYSFCLTMQSTYDI
jgi:hypothetical protein